MLSQWILGNVKKCDLLYVLFACASNIINEDRVNLGSSRKSLFFCLSILTQLNLGEMSKSIVVVIELTLKLVARHGRGVSDI